MIRVVSLVLFGLLFLDIAITQAWLVALGRFLVKPVARITVPSLYRWWVGAGRPSATHVAVHLFDTRKQMIGLGIVGVGLLISEFLLRESENTLSELPASGVYRFYCISVGGPLYDGRCYCCLRGSESCGTGTGWNDPCYGVPDKSGCRDGAPVVSYFLNSVRYSYNKQTNTLSYVDGPLPLGTGTPCYKGCQFFLSREYPFCPSTLPRLGSPSEIISLLGRPHYDSTGQPVERSTAVDVDKIEQDLRRTYPSPVIAPVIPFPDKKSLIDTIAREFPHLSRDEIERGLEGVKDQSQAPSVPRVPPSVGEAVVEEIVDTQTGIGNPPRGENPPRAEPVPAIPGLDTSVPTPQKLPLPLQLISQIAQNHPLVRLLRGLSASCGGSCSVPIAFSGGILNINASLNFCPYESAFSFVGSVLLAFLPLLWLYVRRD